MVDIPPGGSQSEVRTLAVPQPEAYRYRDRTEDPQYPDG